MLREAVSVAMPLHGSVDSPDTSDLQLGLRARLFVFDRLIRDDGGGGAACAHVIKHDVLKGNESRVKRCLYSNRGD